MAANMVPSWLLSTPGVNYTIQQLNVGPLCCVKGVLAHSLLNEILKVHAGELQIPNLIVISVSQHIILNKQHIWIQFRNTDILLSYDDTNPEKIQVIKYAHQAFKLTIALGDHDDVPTFDDVLAMQAQPSSPIQSMNGCEVLIYRRTSWWHKFTDTTIKFYDTLGRKHSIVMNEEAHYNLYPNEVKLGFLPSGTILPPTTGELLLNGEIDVAYFVINGYLYAATPVTVGFGRSWWSCGSLKYRGANCVHMFQARFTRVNLPGAGNAV